MNTHVSRRTAVTVLTTLTIAAGVNVAATPAHADSTSASTWPELRSAVAAGGTVQVTADVTNAPGENLALGATPVVLDLNGHTVEVEVGRVRGAAAVRVGPDADLTIKDTAGAGRLVAEGGGGGAGIGGNGSPDLKMPPETGAGSVTIDSGTVEAYGGELSGAGIGGGAWGNGNCGASVAQDGGTTIKSVTIRGGDVSAYGGTFAAGIGGSDCAPPAAGPIVITGGSVHAEGGGWAAGIGGGAGGDNGFVRIESATVSSRGGSGDGSGAGIGGGSDGAGGTVQIGAGAEVTAEGGQDSVGRKGDSAAVGAGGHGSAGLVQVEKGGTLTPLGYSTCRSQVGSCLDGVGRLENSGHLVIKQAAVDVTASDSFDNAGEITVTNGRITGSGTVHNTGAIVPDADSTVSATVTPNNYTLDLDAGDGSPPVTKQVYAATIAAARQSLGIPGLLTSRGAFIGWFPTPGSAATSADQEVTDTSNLATGLGQDGPKRATLYARYSTMPPRVDAVSPASGKVGGGGVVTISGEAFYGLGRVLFGQTPATSFTVDSHSRITAVVPSHSRGVVDIRLTSKYGTSPVATSDRYTYRASGISSISPAAGPSPGGASVTISGTDIADATSVTFGDNPARFTVKGTTLVATAPAGSAGQVVDVAVSGPAGTATVLDGYRYVAPPVVTTLSVNQGKAAGGDTVVISGSGLGENPTVTFGTAKATVVSRSDGQLTVTAPASVRGVVDVRVRTAGGTSPVVAADKYTYRLIAISTVTPTEGPLAGGTAVTISGTDLATVSSVSFGGVDASFSIKGSTLVAVAPARATGDTVDIAVSSPFNVAVKTGAYRYLAAPTVTGLGTSSGGTAGSDTVVITGTSFGKAPAVYFGSKTAVVVSKTDTQLTVKTPATPRSVVDVRVRTVGGTSAIVDADQFSFVNRTAISPS